MLHTEDKDIAQYSRAALSKVHLVINGVTMGPLVYSFYCPKKQLTYLLYVQLESRLSNHFDSTFLVNMFLVHLL